MKSPDTNRNHRPPKQLYKYIKGVPLKDGAYLTLFKFRKKQWRIYKIRVHYYDDPLPTEPGYDPSHLTPVYINKKLERAETAFARILIMDAINETTTTST